MNSSTLSTTRQLHPPEQQRTPQLQRPHYVVTARHTGVLESVAVSIGVVLIRWGRRPRRVGVVERREVLLEQHRTRMAHERPLHLGTPWW